MNFKQKEKKKRKQKMTPPPPKKTIPENLKQAQHH